MEKKSAADHENTILEARIVVKGCVQGVGFRAATRFIAVEMKLTGDVRNQADGSVEIRIQGSKHQIEEFVQRLENETAGTIDGMDIAYTPSRHSFERFSIVR